MFTHLTQLCISHINLIPKLQIIYFKFANIPAILQALLSDL